MAMVRGVKNVFHNYTEAEIKVREATSNDSWGPTTTLLLEIADLTHNQITFSEVMSMLWKRLNDSGRNWRHVNKSLIVIEYLIKNGNKRVLHQCKDNIFVIDTLKNFQHLEKSGRDEGRTIRNKALDLVKLLKDDELIAEERKKAETTRKRFEQVAGISSVNSVNRTGNSFNDQQLSKNGTRSRSGTNGTQNTRGSDEMEATRPTNINEEDLQLQLALEMSKADADNSKTEKQKEDVRLQMALRQSLREETERKVPVKKPPQPNLLDLNDPWSSTNNSKKSASIPNNTNTVNSNNNVASNSIMADPWGLGMPLPNIGSDNNSLNSANKINKKPQSPAQIDPWGDPTPSNSTLGNSAGISHSSGISDPWGTLSGNSSNTICNTNTNNMAMNQPIGNAQGQTNNNLSQIDPWGAMNNNVNQVQNNIPIMATNSNQNPANSDLFNMNSLLTPINNVNTPTINSNESQKISKTPDLSKQFLGDLGADLVNLDKIASDTTKNTNSGLLNNFTTTQNTRSVSPNVFSQAPVAVSSTNPFASNNVKSGNIFSSNNISANNPFASNQIGPTLNQIRAENMSTVPTSSQDYMDSFFGGSNGIQMQNSMQSMNTNRSNSAQPISSNMISNNQNMMFPGQTNNISNNNNASINPFI